MRLQLLWRRLVESLRHLNLALLVAGTAGGTLFTMSGGRIRLEPHLELLVTTGGVAFASEFAVILIGAHLGKLDALIRVARRPEERDAYKASRKELTGWFYIIVGVSIAANFIYRMQQNWPGAHASTPAEVWAVILSTFVALAPLPLIIVFTIKVRPLPPDYAEQARQAYQRGLVILTEGASYIMARGARRIMAGTATEADHSAMEMAASVLGIHARPDERAQLEYAMSRHAARLAAPDGPVTVDAEVVEYITTRDIMDLWGVPERTAQEWARTCPGRNRRPGSRAWECPRSAIIRLHGQPVTVTSPVPARNRNRNRAASGRNQAATEPQTAAEGPQEPANMALALVYAPLIGGEQPPQNA